MELLLKRYAHGKDSTGGLLFVNGQFFCHTCEDQPQEQKVMNETRIPTGRYLIQLRDAGGMNEKYKRQYPGHRGMLHLQDVPGFEWIYIHTGNTDDHTSGCILVGYNGIKTDHGEYQVQRSRDAYVLLYQLVLLAMGDKREVIWITVEDEVAS